MVPLIENKNQNTEPLYKGKNMQTGIAVVIGLFIGAVVLLALISIMSRRGEKHPLNEKTAEEPELTKRFYLGKYKAGRSGFQEPAPIVFCGVTEKFFVLRKGTQGAEIGRIPRAAIRAVNLSKQSEKNHLLIIEWSPAAGANHSAEFQFIDKIAKQQSTDAADLLRRWSKKETASAAA